MLILNFLCQQEKRLNDERENVLILGVDAVRLAKLFQLLFRLEYMCQDVLGAQLVTLWGAEKIALADTRIVVEGDSIAGLENEEKIQFKVISKLFLTIACHWPLSVTTNNGLWFYSLKIQNADQCALFD